MNKKDRSQFERAKFYHETAEAAWLDVQELVNDYFEHQVFPNTRKQVKAQEFPKSGLLVFRMAKKRILKVLKKGREESLL